MSRQRVARAVASALVVGVLGVVGCKGEKPAPVGGAKADSEAVSLASDIMPVFARSCGVCHKREGGNEEAVEDGKYYESKEDILGNVGKYIIAGDPAKSGLIKVCDQSYPVGDEKIVMPPPESGVPKWSAEELAKLAAWILEGAKDN